MKKKAGCKAVYLKFNWLTLIQLKSILLKINFFIQDLTMWRLVLMMTYKMFQFIYEKFKY